MGVQVNVPPGQSVTVEVDRAPGPGAIGQIEGSDVMSGTSDDGLQ